MTALQRVLLVEDDPDIRTIATMALVDIGELDLTACASGEEALGRIVAVAPQLIVLDVMMPDMDGPTTLAQIRRLPLTPQPPVIFMTAKVQPPERQHYLDLGAIEVIAKPFDPINLADQVKAVWQRYIDGRSGAASG